MAMPRLDGGTSLTTMPSIPACRGDLLEAGDHPQKRGLAAAGRTDEDDELALPDLQVDPVDHINGAVGLLQALKFQAGHASLLPLTPELASPEPGEKSIIG
jgi:hypothetical protein